MTHSKAIALAAKDKTHLDKLKNILTSFSSSIAQEDTIINNIRHYESLKMVDVCIDEIRDGVNQTISNELIALDLRRALQYIGEITGEVEIDRDILGNIFGKFCIGK